MLKFDPGTDQLLTDDAIAEMIKNPGTATPKIVIFEHPLQDIADDRILINACYPPANADPKEEHKNVTSTMITAVISHKPGEERYC